MLEVSTRERGVGAPACANFDVKRRQFEVKGIVVQKYLYV